MALLSLSLLGPLMVARDGVPVEQFGYNKVRGLLVYLAVEAGRPHTRAHLCDLFWPEQPERTARRNLSQALTQLRRSLGETDARPLLLSTPDEIQLNPGFVEVDATDFAGLLAASERHSHRSWHTCAVCAGRLHAALALYRGDFLAGFSLPDSAPFEEWALLWRERLRQRALSALARLAAWAEWRGEYGLAAAYARRQVELDPLNEAAQRDLMRLLALNGELAAAAAQYTELQRVLAAELGLDPEAESVALRDHIRAGALEKLRRWRPPAFEGPQPPNPLLGRSAELAEVLSRLRDDGVRALTITGPPGIGKTCLALEAGSELRFEFEDGVRVVELAPVAEPGAVPLAIAQALGVKEQPGKPLPGTLAVHLRHRHMLLVLDNFEHVLEAAGVVAELLAACPALKVLVTSRSPLRVRAEHTYPLDALGADAARALFAARARAVGARLPESPHGAAAVGEICRRLDYLPLAIELVAVRARALPPAELLRQLEHPLAALTAAPRDLPERQRTLRNAIGWSYDRLRPEEQRAFRHLGVFAGGATLAAVEAVSGAPTPPHAHAPTLSLLEALHDASLVQTQAEAAGEETRFSLLATLREFALEQLDQQAEAMAARQRHLDYFLALAERAEPELIGPHQKQWFERLDRERLNFDSALAWGLAHAPETGLRLAAALVDFWRVRGLMSEGRRWLAHALRQAEGAAPAVRAHGLLAAARMARAQGNLVDAKTLADRARQLYLHVDDARGLAIALSVLGMATMGLAEHAASQAYSDQAISTARACGDWHTLATALNVRARLAARLGDYEFSQVLTEEAIALHEAHQDWRNVAGLKLNLGMNAGDLGDFPLAVQHLEESLRVARELDDRDLIAVALLGLGNLLLDLGDLPKARSAFEEAIAGLRARGETQRLAAPLTALGRVLLESGDLAAARAHLNEGLTLRLEAGEQRGVAQGLENLARLEHREHRSDRAARLWAAAVALRDLIGAPVVPTLRAEHEQFVASLRSALGEASFAQAWASGRALTPEQAVALALEN